MFTLFNIKVIKVSHRCYFPSTYRRCGGALSMVSRRLERNVNNHPKFCYLLSGFEGCNLVLNEENNFRFFDGFNIGLDWLYWVCERKPSYKLLIILSHESDNSSFNAMVPGSNPGQPTTKLRIKTRGYLCRRPLFLCLPFFYFRDFDGLHF